MVVEEILSKIDKEENSSGNGYYDVFITSDFVIKRYENDRHGEKHYQRDVKKHQDLDKFNVLPKMITYFEHDIYYYIVVEKVLCLDHKYTGPRKENAYFRYLENKVENDDFWDEVDSLQKTINQNNYRLCDIHGGNFGYDKNHNFVCLDEGCLYEVRS